MVTQPIHPGTYVRQNVLPAGMTVTEAAKLLGVGRPALSNFLNGKAALSHKMALRLERSFGADRADLLDLQAVYDRREDAFHSTVAAGRHAPTLVQIRAWHIQAWADTEVAKTELPALLRRLICSTGDHLARVDFPAFENGQRRGWDGEVEAMEPTSWIPAGQSGWELSCSRKPGRKADKDYNRRRKKYSSTERRERTYVFVTPRNWPGKNQWAEEKARKRDWKDVRAYDASDLEQWLEQSAETQVWLAERFELPVEGCHSPEMCWSDWADVCEPALSPDLFSIEEYTPKLKQWLKTQPTRPFIVSADSSDEALAFACHLVQKVRVDVGDPSAGAVVLDSPEILQRFRASKSAPHMAIIHNPEVEKEISDLCDRCHCIVIRPSNDVRSVSEVSDAGGEPDIRLGLPNRQKVSDALKSMGIDEDKADLLIRESGRSLAVLRRLLSSVSAIREPDWARNPALARKLLPAALVGAWSKANAADVEVVRRLAVMAGIDGDKTYVKDGDNVIETHVVELLNLPDSPLWCRGDYRGVVSRIDALFGVARFVTEQDIKTFFTVAESVLGEPDPAFELPEDERWTAGFHGKVRTHSSALREGIRATLVLLSLHGNRLFRNRLNVDIEAKVSRLIRRLLSPLSLETLLSHQDDLPDYAEAAPDEFLKVVEADLNTSKPAVFDLLKPVGAGLFHGCPRTGLIWALECLAWKHLPRVSRILAELARTPIDDNRVHKPIESLQAIYRSWLPQTAAMLDDRLYGIRLLVDSWPDIAWQVCIAQFDTGPQHAMPGYRPRWRDDHVGAGKFVPKAHSKFKNKVLDIVLEWQHHNQRTLGDLVDRIHGFSDEARIRIWNLIDTWANAQTDDRAKAELREEIRLSVFTHGTMLKSMPEEVLARARTALERLKPQDPVARHAWLFRTYWVEPSPDEFSDSGEITLGRADRDENQDEISRKLRSAAMGEIWSECGFQGVVGILEDCTVPDAVGQALKSHVPDTGAIVRFLHQCLSTATPVSEATMDACLSGFIGSTEEEARTEILTKSAEHLASSDELARLFRCAPFRPYTWRLVDEYGLRDCYWQTVTPEIGPFTESEMPEFIDRMLDAKRFRAAFWFTRFSYAKIETAQLHRLLIGLVTKAAGPDENRQYEPSNHDVAEAIQELRSRSGIDRSEVARLELMFIEALRYSDYGMLTLERLVAESPIDFVRLLALSFNRKDDGQDPPAWNMADSKGHADLRMAAFQVLEYMSYIPGTGDDDEIDGAYLSQWIAETRRLCAEYGREAVGDERVGQLLARGPADENGVTPCEAISTAMEKVRSERLALGFRIGAVSPGGVVAYFREEGGARERELSATYRNWAAERSRQYPFVGSVLEEVAAYYDRRARMEDDRTEVEHRLEY